jgi:hypothetical protein
MQPLKGTTFPQWQTRQLQPLSTGRPPHSPSTPPTLRSSLPDTSSSCSLLRAPLERTALRLMVLLPSSAQTWTLCCPRLGGSCATSAGRHVSRPPRQQRQAATAVGCQVMLRRQPRQQQQQQQQQQQAGTTAGCCILVTTTPSQPAAGSVAAGTASTGRQGNGHQQAASSAVRSGVGAGLGVRLYGRGVGGGVTHSCQRARCS